MGCLDDNTVAAFVEQLLSGERRTAVEEHLDSCPSCRRLVAQISGDGGLSRVDEGVSGLSGVTPFSGRALDDDALGFAAGQVIADRYALERELGRGAMGSVWAAHDRRLRRQVAVKLLMRHADRLTVARFEREATAVARMRSAHIVEVYDYGVEAGTPFIVMELLEGVSLRTLTKQSAGLPLAEVADIVSQIADALTVAHDHGIVHRDLKPANVFVCQDVRRRVVKVFDFGVAKAYGDGSMSTEATTEGTIIGTPRYMSPEQVRGDKDVDHRSDIWALGVIAYELLCGRQPFTADNVGELIADILKSGFARATTLVSGLPPAIDAFFARALAKDPAARYASAAELAAHFGAIALGKAPAALASLPVEAEAAPGGFAPSDHTLDATASTIQLPRRRAARSLALGIGAVLALVAGGSLYWFTQRGAAAVALARMPVRELARTAIAAAQPAPEVMTHD